MEGFRVAEFNEWDFVCLTKLLEGEAEAYGCRVLVTTRRDETIHVELWREDGEWHDIEIDWMRHLGDMSASEALEIARAKILRANPEAV